MKPDLAKTLGGIGSMLIFSLSVIMFIYLRMKGFFEPCLLVAAAVISSFFWAPLNLIASIPVLFGLRGLGSYYNDESIKRNSLRWFIWWAVMVTAASYAITYPFLLTKYVEISAISTNIIAFILIVTTSIIISAIYLRRVYIALTARTGVDLFDAAAKLYLVGSPLLMLGIGVFIIWASWLVSSEAFFSMKLQRPGGVLQST